MSLLELQTYDSLTTILTFTINDYNLTKSGPKESESIKSVSLFIWTSFIFHFKGPNSKNAFKKALGT